MLNLFFFFFFSLTKNFVHLNIFICRYFEFPDGKHNIHLQYAAEFNEKVANFILGNGQ